MLKHSLAYCLLNGYALIIYPICINIRVVFVLRKYVLTCTCQHIHVSIQQILLREKETALNSKELSVDFDMVSRRPQLKLETANKSLFLFTSFWVLKLSCNIISNMCKPANAVVVNVESVKAKTDGPIGQITDVDELFIKNQE